MGHVLDADILEISIHALLAESDFEFEGTDAAGMLFLSTLSLRRATEQLSCQNPFSEISIHALLAESDVLAVSCM